MEHQVIQNHGGMEDEGFPDEFQCCVCLDLVYKPVVLACGHISCFWCVFKAMDFLQESRCPVCRNPYNHFPRICELLHFLLLKLYPQAYKRREKQVAEEEKKKGHESPQFDSNLIDSRFSKVNDVRNDSSPLVGAVPIEPNATCGGDHSLVQGSSQRTFHEDSATAIPTTSSSQTTTNEANFVIGHTDKVLSADLLCAVCKQLLCRPVVLNCGHVYCEACINPNDSFCKCPMCQSAHPKGFPNVCLVLEHFLEEHFPEEYSARNASLHNFQSASPSRRSGEKEERAAQSSRVPTDVYSSLFSGNGAKFHPWVGCDYCGMCPIIGLRYRCKDCVEKIGFDLCEDCHNSSSKLPGRFNQQHTKEHQFEILKPPNLLHRISSFGVELSGAYDDDEETGVISDNEDIRIVYMSNDTPENEPEITVSLNGDNPEDLENATVSPDLTNNHSENQVDDSAT